MPALFACGNKAPVLPWPSAIARCGVRATPSNTYGQSSSTANRPLRLSNQDKRTRMNQWEVVIGIETHAQPPTQSKIFSGASTAFGAEPNTQACAVDLALPGVLPVLNRGAVECAIKFGLAIDAEVAQKSVFARKNYFIQTCRRAIRSASSNFRSSSVASSRSKSVRVKRHRKTVRLTRAPP